MSSGRRLPWQVVARSVAVRLATVVSSLGAVSCGGTIVATFPGPGAPVELRGSLAYEARTATFRGVSAAVTLRPARRVRVQALADGHFVGEAVVADDGSFRLVSHGAPDRLRFLASIDVPGHRLDISRDRAGHDVHAFEVEVRPDGVYVARDDTEAGEGGAFHMLDTLLRGTEWVAQQVDTPLPPLRVYWGRGVTHDWSYYEGEQPEGSGRFRLELLGGEAGRRAASDTDEHDEAVVLHELGHFVFDRLASASSTGGQHPSGYFVDPGLAWEEGRATWFAAVVLGRGLYTDTIGIEPSGGLQVHTDLEGRSPPPRGLGSQETVEEVLWDLVDGSSSLPDDRDHDGAAIEPARLFAAMIAMGREPRAYPCLPTFLRYLVDTGVIDESGIRGVLRTGSLPDALLPSGGVSPWPIALALGTEVSGRIDSLTDPAPSGGPRLPRTGFDAVHTYRVELPSDGRLIASLTIDGAGGEGDRTDLDLELLDLHADELASSRGTTSRERLAQRLPAGSYVVRVVDGGAEGSRARYRLRVTAETSDP